ncbi:hypothetical protein MTO96_001019 [Rhipicephalus appendiculatus]
MSGPCQNGLANISAIGRAANAHLRPSSPSPSEQSGADRPRGRQPEAATLRDAHRGVPRNGVGRVLCSPGGLPPSAKEDDVRACTRAARRRRGRSTPTCPRFASPSPRAGRGADLRTKEAAGLFLLLSSAAVLRSPQPDPSGTRADTLLARCV